MRFQKKGIKSPILRNLFHPQELQNLLGSTVIPFHFSFYRKNGEDVPQEEVFTAHPGERILLTCHQEEEDIRFLYGKEILVLAYRKRQQERCWEGDRESSCPSLSLSLSSETK